MDAGGEMIVGLDPGFANFGVVTAWNLRGGLVFDRGAVIKTRPCKDLSKAEDLISRSDSLAQDLAWFVEQGRPPDVFAVCCEGFSRPPHAGTAIKLGAANGIVGALCSRWTPNVISVETPSNIRKRIFGAKRTPPEADVHAWLIELYRELGPILEDYCKGDRLHILDAAAAVVAAFKQGRL